MSTIKRQNVILKKIEHDDIKDKALEEYTANEFYEALDQIDDKEDEDLKLQKDTRKRISNKARKVPQKTSVPDWASLSIAAMPHGSNSNYYFFKK